jgi:predicted RNA binding protein YcfA (HicA-like mRNA interferase family)
MPVQLSGRELVKALSKDGWEIVRVSGTTTSWASSTAAE